MNRSQIRNLAPLDALISRAITLYQRHLSPHKGGRCAYSALHGGAGCSGAVRSAVEMHGWRAARRLARQRFRECTAAAQILHAQNGADSSAAVAENAQRPGQKRSWWKDCCDCNPLTCIDPLSCFDFFPHCATGDLVGVHGCCAHSAPTDCAPSDCSPCDCHPFH